MYFFLAGLKIRLLGKLSLHQSLWKGVGHYESVQFTINLGRSNQASRKCISSVEIFILMLPVKQRSE